MRIYVAVACHNRKRTAELCLPTLKGALGHDDALVLYNDGSTEYDKRFLQQWTTNVVSHPNIGIEAERRLHLDDFWRSHAEFLYFTDHDAIHDPMALEEGLRLQKKYGGPLVCLYNTMAHVRIPGNTTGDLKSSGVIWRRYAPGISYLLTRDHVKDIMPHLSRITNFDWNIPDILGNQCAITRTSYCDHVGIGGLRHPESDGPDGGDRGLSPTPWLVAKRAEIVTALTYDCASHNLD